jgi:two-component system KDP operon response regulator KdpE
MPSTRILVVDDEVQILRAVRGIFEARGYVVDVAQDAASALDSLMRSTPDLVILDLTLPDADGKDLCGQVRTWLSVPILVLSVRSDEADKIGALETGADDYLTKPFSAGELVARVRALLRRAQGGAVATPSVEFGDIVVDVGAHSVTRNGELVSLTPIEFDVIALLARYADRLVTWNQIREAVWGQDAIVDSATLRVHVSNLRRKVEPHASVPRYILTEPGVGLRLNTRPDR